MEKLLKSWIRSHHLICYANCFIFETVDQSHLDKFESCIEGLGGYLDSVSACGNWPMGPNRHFKILRAIAQVPKPGCEHIVNYWASRGSIKTRYAEIY